MLSRLMGGLGRVLITGGTLILLFVAYMLWGTGLQEAASQRGLEKEFAETLEATTTTPTSTSTTTSTSAPEDPSLTVVEPETVDLPLPAIGDPMAQIRMPSIGVNRTVVESISLDQLKRGPGHYPETPMPGQKGNVAIAGHRTTYGQPFHNFDKVNEGDEIFLKTVQGEFVYRVTEVVIVEPDQVEILEDKGDNRVTLIACHPKYSAAQRLIVIGELEGEVVPEIEGQAEIRKEAVEEGQLVGESIDGGLSGETKSNTPVILWGLAAAAVWLTTWAFQVMIRRRTRARAEDSGAPSTRGQRMLQWAPYVVGLPVFLLVLYGFFESFSNLLPANY